MRDALARFGGEADDIVASFLATLGAQLPPLIFHYTNDVGLRGILESGQLWLTDIFSLNDPSELSHGLSHAVNILSNKASTGPPESKIFAADIAAFIQQGGIRKSGHYFMCSLSSNGDDLGQWRAYADNGRGYALGFDAKALEDAFAKHGGGPMLKAFPITYNDSALIEMHRRMIDRMFGLISLPRGKQLNSGAVKEYIADLSTLLIVHALHAALHFKHEAYRNEAEYRLLQIHGVDKPPPEAKLRVRAYSLIKYREFHWRSAGAATLRKIVVGPAADFEKASQFAKDCLTLPSQGTVEITRSEIPYRAV